MRQVRIAPGLMSGYSSSSSGSSSEATSEESESSHEALTKEAYLCFLGDEGTQGDEFADSSA